VRKAAAKVAKERQADVLSPCAEQEMRVRRRGIG